MRQSDFSAGRHQFQDYSLHVLACNVGPSSPKPKSFTWTPKVCKIMAFLAIIRGLGLLFLHTFGV